MKISGQATVQNGELILWRGTADWSHTEGIGWGAKNARLETQFKNHKFSGILKADRIELDSANLFAPLVRQIRPIVKWPWTVHGFHASFEIEGVHRAIKEMVAQDERGQKIEVKGQWRPEEPFEGVVNWSGQNKKWALIGRDEDWKLK
jgi:hypothetical protein